MEVVSYTPGRGRFALVNFPREVGVYRQGEMEAVHFWDELVCGPPAVGRGIVVDLRQNLRFRRLLLIVRILVTIKVRFVKSAHTCNIRPTIVQIWYGDSGKYTAFMLSYDPLLSIQYQSGFPISKI